MAREPECPEALGTKLIITILGNVADPGKSLITRLFDDLQVTDLYKDSYLLQVLITYLLCKVMLLLDS